MTAGTVMIVDDSLVIRAVVQAGLEVEGYQVIQAADGTAALGTAGDSRGHCNDPRREFPSDE